MNNCLSSFETEFLANLTRYDFKKIYRTLNGHLYAWATHSHLESAVSSSVKVTTSVYQVKIQSSFQSFVCHNLNFVNLILCLKYLLIPFNKNFY